MMTLEKSHLHKWESLRKGMALSLCRCGAVRVPGAKAGKNTISLSPAGDVVRWSANAAAAALGDIGMRVANGRPQWFSQGENRQMPFGKEMIDGDGSMRYWKIQQNAALTTLINTGFDTAPTAVGTATVVNVTTGEGQFIQYLSAAIAGSNGGVVATAFNQTQRIYEPIYDLGIRTPATITNGRWWFGLFSGDPMGSATPALHYMGFRFDTAVDGTTFRCVTDDGSGVPTVTNSTVTFVGTTSFRLRIIVNAGAGTIRFFINGTERAVHTTTLPGATTDLGHCQQCQTSDAVAKGYRFGVLRVSQRAA
jgi:hypothetical protein